jgi:hypothetical protein
VKAWGYRTHLEGPLGDEVSTLARAQTETTPFLSLRGNDIALLEEDVPKRVQLGETLLPELCRAPCATYKASTGIRSLSLLPFATFPWQPGDRIDSPDLILSSSSPSNSKLPMFCGGPDAFASNVALASEGTWKNCHNGCCLCFLSVKPAKYSSPGGYVFGSGSPEGSETGVVRAGRVGMALPLGVNLAACKAARVDEEPEGEGETSWPVGSRTCVGSGPRWSVCGRGAWWCSCVEGEMEGVGGAPPWPGLGIWRLVVCISRRRRGRRDMLGGERGVSVTATYSDRMEIRA